MLKEGMKVVRKLDGVSDGSKTWWREQKIHRRYKDNSLFTIHSFRFGEEIILLDDAGRFLTAAKCNWLPAHPSTSIEDWM